MVIEWAHMGAFNQFVIEEMAHQFMMGPTFGKEIQTWGVFAFPQFGKGKNVFKLC